MGEGEGSRHRARTAWPEAPVFCVCDQRLMSSETYSLVGLIIFLYPSFVKLRANLRFTPMRLNSHLHLCV